MTNDPLQLVIVSNRLPVVINETRGRWDVQPGSGGLVTAMSPVLKNRGGIWIGWAGTLSEQGVPLDELLAESRTEYGYSLRPVVLTEAERDSFYYGFANEIIWPLFHSLTERCHFCPEYWDGYQQVNRKYASKIQESLEAKERYIWVHDYHLMCVGRELRRMGVKDRVGYFLHIPFPPVDIFLKLPWRFQILRSLLEYDVVGFQTVRDRENFTNCVKTLLPNARASGRGRIHHVTTPSRDTLVGAFPISIDFNEFAGNSGFDGVDEKAAEFEREYAACKVVFGLDRLDYTKGIPARLNAFRRLLERFPKLRRKVRMVQVVVPSREGIPAYRTLREEIDGLVGEINGRFGEPGWVPIHYLYRALSRVELLAYYRSAAVALITPLMDGMNLVAKEYCAANAAENGVLILSEFAGAAAELQDGALLVNPYDMDGVADAIRQALSLSSAERRERMGKLRRKLKRRDVFWWLNSFLEASIARKLDDLPAADVYVPIEDGAEPATATESRDSSGSPGPDDSSGTEMPPDAAIIATGESTIIDDHHPARATDPDGPFRAALQTDRMRSSSARSSTSWSAARKEPNAIAHLIVRHRTARPEVRGALRSQTHAR